MCHPSTKLNQLNQYSIGHDVLICGDCLVFGLFVVFVVCFLIPSRPL